MSPPQIIAESEPAAAHEQAEVGARANQERFRLFADSYPGALVIYDASLRFVFLNSRVLQWSDRPLEEWIGRRDEDVFPPEVTRAYMPLLRQAVETCVPQAAEIRITFCGESIDLIIHYIPALDADGNVREVLGIARDMTHQRHIEQQLLSRDQELSSVADNVPDVIARFDRDGRHLYVNRQVEPLSGIPAEKYLGKTNAELGMPAELVAQWNETLRQVFTSGAPVESQFVWPASTPPRYFEVRLLPEFDSDSAVQSVLVIARDITEKRRVLLQLSESEQRFRMAFEAAPIGIALISREGRLLEVNRALCEMLGYAEADLTGLTLSDITHPDDLPATLAHAQATFEQGARAVTLEKRYQSRDGRVIWGRVTSTVVRDEQGEPLYSIRMIQDITESRGTNQELKRYREHLEELVRSRTRALEASQESLRSAERLASLGTLAAGIAHEINNPVGTILLAAEMAIAAEAGGDRDSLLRCLEAIKADAQRCGRIVKNVLSFARHQPTDKSPYPVNETVRQAIERTKDYAARRAAQVGVDLDLRVGRVLMNSVAIEQALVNILRNAIESGPDAVVIRIATVEAQGCYAITIADNGPGMSPEVQRHIFDPFFTMRRANGGTGLGLSLVHGTINEHQGTIRVDSQPGRGTTFTIELPRFDESR